MGGSSKIWSRLYNGTMKELSLSGHTHSGYALSNHTHSNYSTSKIYFPTSISGSGDSSSDPVVITFPNAPTLIICSQQSSPRDYGNTFSIVASAFTTSYQQGKGIASANYTQYIWGKKSSDGKIFYTYKTDNVSLITTKAIIFGVSI